MSKSKSKKKKKISPVLRKNLLMLLLITIFLSVGYAGIKYYEASGMPSEIHNETNTDYVMLENPDPDIYIATVIYNKNININTVSNTFYDDRRFWSYIFIANRDKEEVTSNPLDIRGGTVLRIPVIPDLKTSNGEINPAALSRAEILSDSILNYKKPLVSSEFY